MTQNNNTKMVDCNGTELVAGDIVRWWCTHPDEGEDLGGFGEVVQYCHMNTPGGGVLVKVTTSDRQPFWPRSGHMGQPSSDVEKVS